MGKRRKNQGREINGILLLNKPIGLTSNAALQEVKYLYFAKKAGHTGSLDPLATGMLPLCFGEATKLSQFLLDADKHYTVTGKLGEKTTTADAEGEVIETKPVDATEDQIEALLSNFRGEIQQVPSMYSALKHQGKPLYEWAREGVTIEREARTVNIHHLALTEFTGDTFSLDVKCSKGTYIRNLVEDIGDALGCGAHVIKLDRVSVADYTDIPMVELDQLKAMKEENQFQEMDDLLLPTTSMIDYLPKVTLSPVASFQLQQGNPVQIKEAPASGLVQLFDKDEKFIGVGEIDADGNVAPKRLLKS